MCVFMLCMFVRVYAVVFVGNFLNRDKHYTVLIISDFHNEVFELVL